MTGQVFCICMMLIGLLQAFSASGSPIVAGGAFISAALVYCLIIRMSQRAVDRGRLASLEAQYAADTNLLKRGHNFTGARSSVSVLMASAYCVSAAATSQSLIPSVRLTTEAELKTANSDQPVSAKFLPHIGKVVNLRVFQLTSCQLIINIYALEKDP